MATSPNEPIEYVGVPQGARNIQVWAKRVADPQGLGRNGYAYLSEATIDATGLAMEIADLLSKATPADVAMVDSGNGTEYIRRLKYDTTGAFIGFEDRLPDGTLYTPTGPQFIHPKEKETFFISAESIAFDATPRGLISIPANADWAQIHVWGGDLVWTQSSIDPNEPIFDAIRNNDGTTMWLRSNDEINRFRFQGYDAGDGADTGELYVEYFELR